MGFDPRAKFKITADASDYKRKLKAATRDTNNFANSAKGAMRVGAAAGAAAVVAVTVALVRLSSEAAKSADALAKQSDILGISTQKLAAYQHAARLSGSSNDGLEKGFRKLQKSIVDANNGMTTYTRAFDALKLDPSELEALTPDKQFEALAQSFAGVENQAQRVAIAYDLFGGRNTELLNTLLLTGSQLNQIESDTKAWGVALTRIDAKTIEDANDAAERAKTAMQGIGTSIALAIAPIRTDLGNSFADAAAEADGFKAEIQATMEALVVGANFAMNAVRGIQLALLAAKMAALSIEEKFSMQGSDVVPGVDLSRASAAVVAAHEAALAQVRSDRNREYSALIDEIDRTGQAIDLILGKFQDGDAALTNFRRKQEEAIATAREGLERSAGGAGGKQDEGDGDSFFSEAQKQQLATRLQAVQATLLSETDAMRNAFLEREAIVQEAFERGLIQDEEKNQILFELKIQLDDETLQRAQAQADKLVAIERKRIDQQVALEQRHQAVVTALRSRAVDTALQILQTLGQRSKTLAKIAFIAEKAAAVARIIVNTNIAATLALSQMGPAAGAPVAASITAWGYGLAAATGALGITQGATGGASSPSISGSAVATIGAQSSLLDSSVGSNQQQDSQQPKNVVNITIMGSLLSGQDTLDSLKGWIRDLTDADEVIINGSSRQAVEIRGTV